MLGLRRRLSSEAAEVGTGKGRAAGESFRSRGGRNISRGTDRDGLERAAFFSIRGAACGVAYL